ncbi:VOC family protein [Clostridium sp. Mt-5]|uniref:VOC family protein n=1 Tax=Clostridium moutaii TaxID=3240932 RepID=A0ABV4BT90_9CLOT
MNFCWITLNVEDMEKSLEFYHELLGVEILKRFSPGKEVEIVMLGEENKPKIELICNKKNKVKNQSEGISIGFEVEWLDEAMSYVKSKNIPIKKGPISPSPKVRFFFIEDPNGIQIQLVENK